MRFISISALLSQEADPIEYTNSFHALLPLAAFLEEYFTLTESVNTQASLCGLFYMTFSLLALPLPHPFDSWRQEMVLCYWPWGSLFHVVPQYHILGFFLC